MVMNMPRLQHASYLSERLCINHCSFEQFYLNCGWMVKHAQKLLRLSCSCSLKHAVCTNLLQGSACLYTQCKKGHSAHSMPQTSTMHTFPAVHWNSKCPLGVPNIQSPKTMVDWPDEYIIMANSLTPYVILQAYKGQHC